ncbi:MAG: hypothetical protein P4L42_00795 [Desulfocapsaceae bacterium]|nr:hypothetical protein [Desulfocapsaceae bacterium]
MALNDLELSLMAFPQRWDGPSGTLTVNILLLPVGDPTAPLGGGPQFAGTAVPLIVNLAAGLASLPSTSTAPAKSVSFLAQPPAVATQLFTGLYNQLVAKGIAVKSGKLTTVPPAAARIRKSLPQSYTGAFPFNKPRSGDIFVGQGFGCALRGQAPPVNSTLPPPDKAISWGQILSYALRQPALARSLGLIYTVSMTVPAAMVAGGGFLWVSLDTSSLTNPWVADWKANADTVKSYAARIPELDAAHNRPLFAASLLPIVTTPPSNLAQAQLEAEEYDDGFAQIVHANQPETIDTATLDADQIAPGTEAGIQLGWDDEQVTVWLNNQIDLLRDRVGATTLTPEAPLGVQGYRVDVRLQGDSQWDSLCVVNGTLPFNQTTYGAPASTSISGNEFWLSPAPVRVSMDDNSMNDNPAWLPLYFAQWAGSSLVLPDPVVNLLAFAVQNANSSPPPPLPPLTLANPNPDLTAVPVLRYGNTYEFRVRLVDITGGGPLMTDPAIHPGPAPTTAIRFLRYVPPKSLEVAASPGLTPFPVAPPALAPPAVRTIQTLSVQRPRISYPEAVFAGVDPSTFDLANLGTLIQQAWASGRAINVPDPDVDRFEVRVEARIPINDTGQSGTDPGDLDGLYRVLYSVEVPFPAGADPTVTLALDYTDGIDDIAKIPPPPIGTTTLPIPTSRDIRVRLFPKAAVRTGYYGSDAAMVGLSSDYAVRKEAAAEDALFTSTPELQLQAFFFQPGANIAQILGQQMNLQQQDLTFTGQPGIRTVFGGSGTLRHSISPDGGSFVFSNQTELLGHWLVALVLDVERDWTWTGFGSPALSYQRDGRDIGTVLLPPVIGPGISGNPGQKPQRSFSRIIFFDGVNPQPGPGDFPKELQLNYTVTASFNSAASQQYPFTIHLPVTTPPVQVPKIVATGIAESPYHHSPTYAETALRDRFLWIEFDSPINDPEDTYFARVLAYGPDPLLAGDLLPQYNVSRMLADTIEPALPVDPEPVRRIFSGQSGDESGLEAMTRMVPADPVGVGSSGRHFLLPLPANLTAEDLELFGFWTYEFRVGHAGLWSTAQGRFGRPLRVSGIQHPCPHLICTPQRIANGVGATAPFAVTVYNGNRLYDLKTGDPQTRIWFMLYAQVLQADGASYRNILLDHREGTILANSPLKGQIRLNPQHGPNRSPIAGILFPQKDIEARLTLVCLPAGTALSVLAVEVLPGPLVDPNRDLVADSTGTTGAGGTSTDTLREDPLGAGLGSRRILRTSPLTAVPFIC